MDAVKGGLMRTKPLVTRAIWDFYQKLKDDKKINMGKYWPIFQSRLSVIFDPNELDRYPGDKEIVLNEGVDILLVSTPPDGCPIIAFDIREHNRRHDATEQIHALLNRYNIPYFLVDEDLSDEVFRKIYNLELEKHYSHRKVINKWQLEAANTASAGVKDNKLLCLHEVALDSLIHIEMKELKSIDLSLYNRLSKKRNFPRQSTVDAVICTSPPNSIALVVIEFDGKSHGELEQESKDVLEDDLLDSVGIPVIRVSSTEFGNPKDHRQRKALDVRREFISFVADRLSRQLIESKRLLGNLHDFLVDEGLALADIAPASSKNILQYASDIKRLTEHREKKIQDQLLEVSESQNNLLEELEIHNEGLMEASSERDNLEFEIVQLAHFLGIPEDQLSVRNLPIKYSFTSENKFGRITVIGCIHFDDVSSSVFSQPSQQFRSPSIKLDVSGVSRSILTKWAEEYLRQYLEVNEIYPYLESREKMLITSARHAAEKRWKEANKKWHRH